MMRLFLLLLLISSVLFANTEKLNTQEREWIKNNQEVLFTGDPNWLPFEAFDSKGNYIGIVSDYLKFIEKKTGLKFSPTVVKDWSESLEVAKKREVTVVSGDAADKTLNQNFRPIDPYLINPIIILMTDHANYVEDLNVLKNKKVAIIKDYGYTADLFLHYPQMKFNEVENVQTALLGLSNGTYDAVLASHALARYAISKMGLDDIKTVGKTSVVMEVTLFVDKKEPILYNIINKTVHSISTNKEREITNKWASKGASTNRFDTFLIWVIFTLIITILVFSVHAYVTLRKNKQHLIHLKKLESAQELGRMGTWEWDLVTGELTWSNEVYRIFGEEPQSFPATYEAFKSYIPEEFHEGIELAINTAMKTHEPYEYDHLIRQKDGTIRSVREAGYVRYNEKDDPISMLGTVLDINSVIQARSSIRENKELTELLKKFDDNVIASNTNLKGIITYASKAFADISGYSVDELIGKPHNIIRNKNTPSKTYKKLWSTIQAGKTWKGKLKNTKKNGDTYWVSSTVSPIYDDMEKIVGYSSIRRDITHAMKVQELHRSLKIKSSELQKLNEELGQRIEEAVEESKRKDHLMAQQNKLASMGEMIGNIAHQWRQPLNALSLLLQKQRIFYERGLLTSEKLQESVDKGTMLINKMSSTIDDFRDFFKPGKQKVLFNIKHAVNHTLELIDAAIYNQNIALTFNIQEDLEVYGYENEFSQVVLNIINNAKDILVENKKTGAQIKIEGAIKDGYIILQIEDNGGGIPEDSITKVFEPYFTTKEEGQGTGIGLYMSKMIIEENMGGKIDVKNGPEGAVFCICFDINKIDSIKKDEM